MVGQAGSWLAGALLLGHCCWCIGSGFDIDDSVLAAKVMNTKLDNMALDPSTAKAAVAVARQSLELFFREDVIFHPDLSLLPVQLSETGSTFVTITNHGKLRGCMGSTEARYPLAKDIARNAVSAASRDFRFPSVTTAELPDVRLEVTILTKPAPLLYRNYDELKELLKPGLHGVILSSGMRKGLLLPQVWERLPDPDRFLEMIALKASISAGALRDIPPSVEVQIFEAHHYSELGYQEPGG